jgi:DNA-binding HxlR family transcriptional regulator
VAVDCISGKWKPTLIYHLKRGPLRFTELRKLVPRAAPKVITEQLRQLEADGLVARHPLADEIPKGVAYSLAPAALTLLPILQSLHEWGVAHARTHHIHLHLPDHQGESRDR